MNVNNGTVEYKSHNASIISMNALYLVDFFEFSHESRI